MDSPATRPFSSLLEEAASPIDILLVGDGTGASLGGWVYLSAQGLAQRYDRPAYIHEWDVATGDVYLDPPIHVTDGSNGPIRFWNASVSRNIDFIDSVLAGMRPPSQIDLVLVNNGLDMGPGTLAVESIPLMRTLQREHEDAAVVAILQPVPKGSDTQTDAQRQNIRDLDISSKKNNFQTVDVRTALDGDPDAYDLGQRYANLQGQRLWAETIVDSLGTDILLPVA